MLKKLFKFFFLLIFLLICLVLIQTWRFSKPIPGIKATTIPALPDSALEHLSAAIHIPTVSISDTLPTDTVAFNQLKAFLEKAFPMVHQRLPRTIINGFSYVYYWEGRESTLSPYILMAHQDVVPVEAASLKEWKAPP